jgi:hypothetical protein
MLKGIHLALLAGPVIPVPVPQPVIDALTGVEAHTDSEGQSGFELTFTLSNRSPLQTFFLIAGGQTPLMRVVLVVTMNGIPHVLMDGVITKNQVVPSNQPGVSTLKITGTDLTELMKKLDMSGLPYPALPAEARVQTILAKYAMFGIIPLVIPTLFTDFTTPVEKIFSQRGNDYIYVTNLAREIGYVFYIEPGPVPGVSLAYWGPPLKIGVPQPALNIDMDSDTNVESLNFSFNGADNTMPFVFIQNAITKFPIPIPIPNLNPLQPPLGAIPAPITKWNFMKDTAKLSPMKAVMKGIAEASQSADAVEGNGSLNVLRYGRVLKARGLVGVRGAGMAYDGLYYVKSVSSTLKRGEFKQNFTLTRNGIVSLTPMVPV